MKENRTHFLFHFFPSISLFIFLFFNEKVQVKFESFPCWTIFLIHLPKGTFNTQNSPPCFFSLYKKWRQNKSGNINGHNNGGNLITNHISSLKKVKIKKWTIDFSEKYLHVFNISQKEQLLLSLMFQEKINCWEPYSSI